MSEKSSISPELFLLDSLADFQEHALKLSTQARRSIAILSRNLDSAVYGTDPFVDAISAFARTSRYAEVKILVKNTKPLAESGHNLAKLSQRLSSKIILRKLIIEPDDTDMGFMLCDTQAILFKNDEDTYRGFANYEAAVEVNRFREIFDYAWQYAEPEPELQLLHI